MNDLKIVLSVTTTLRECNPDIRIDTANPPSPETTPPPVLFPLQKATFKEIRQPYYQNPEQTYILNPERNPKNP